jgi:hypothetical protein
MATLLRDAFVPIEYDSFLLCSQIARQLTLLVNVYSQVF